MLKLHLSNFVEDFVSDKLRHVVDVVVDSTTKSEATRKSTTKSDKWSLSVRQAYSACFLYCVLCVQALSDGQSTSGR